MTTTLPPAATAAAPADANPEASLARAFVLDTDRHVFLTGRAGTGKTTFLRRLREGPLSRKRHVVVAPTGVAAINAGGATIHSTFGLPFGTLTPERIRAELGRRRVSKKKERLLRAIDLLVVDEVSMVRADVLDAMDYVLRRTRRSREPFGGVQLLLIGDLRQLSPVVTRDEEAEMAARYATPYFFSAEVLQSAELVTVELQRVYRQDDDAFVELLGHVRTGAISRGVIDALNARHVRPGDAAFPGPDDGYITLASHRHTAADINRRRLAAVPGPATRYEAKVTGTFPTSAYPTQETLELKVGAQVMFVKNDSEGAFYNGKIGTVTKLADASVTVDCADGGEAIEVSRLAWENTKYALDEGSKRVSADVAGRFSQIPLRLAYAITIHKSQGLTFDRVIVDAADAFAHGQVYVALSRCRSLEGIVLRSPLHGGCVPEDGNVAAYTEAARARAPGEAALAAARRAYRRGLIAKAFDLTGVRRATRDFLRFYLRNESAYASRQGPAFEAAAREADKAVFGVALAFGEPLAELTRDIDVDAETIAVPERCRRGAQYLLTKLNEGLVNFAADLDLVTDNKQVEKRTKDLSHDLARELATARASLRALDAEAFAAEDFERARTDASLAVGAGAVKASGRSRRAKANGANGAGPDAESASREQAHPALLERLVAWRAERVADTGLPAYCVSSTQTLRDVAHVLPTSSAQLLGVRGIGKAKLASYGADLLRLVAEYAEAQGVEPASAGESSLSFRAPPAREAVTATVALSLSMFGNGHSVEEVAAERELAVSTVRGHLAEAVRAGELQLAEILDPKLRDTLEDYFAGGSPTRDISEAFRAFGGRVDHGTLRLVRDMTRDEG